MKLIYCPYCQDLLKLRILLPRYCQCKRVAGMYLDNLYAVATHGAICIGISNPSFSSALFHEDVFAGWIFGKHHANEHMHLESMKDFKLRVKGMRSNTNEPTTVTLGKE